MGGRARCGWYCPTVARVGGKRAARPAKRGQTERRPQRRRNFSGRPFFFFPQSLGCTSLSLSLFPRLRALAAADTHAVWQLGLHFTSKACFLNVTSILSLSSVARSSTSVGRNECCFCCRLTYVKRTYARGDRKTGTATLCGRRLDQAGSIARIYKRAGAACVTVLRYLSQRWVGCTPRKAAYGDDRPRKTCRGASVHWLRGTTDCLSLL